MKLLNIDKNAKTVKGQKKGYMTAVLYLAPTDISGYQVCPNASPGCAMACLNTTGRGRFDNVQNARIRKTKYFFKNRAMFLDQLDKEIISFKKKAIRKGLIPVIRLNGTSDLAWEVYGVFQKHSDIQFYDYTKNYARMIKFLDRKMPKNYHLTFSRSEINQDQCNEVLRLGGLVAMVFRKELLEYMIKYDKVYSGESHDLTFLWGPGILGVKAKGKAKKDKTTVNEQIAKKAFYWSGKIILLGFVLMMIAYTFGMLAKLFI